MAEAMKQALAITDWLPKFELPVLTRDLRGRMRGARAFVVMFVYVATLCGLAAFYMVAALWTPVTAGIASPYRPAVTVEPPGRELLLALAWVQLALIAVLAPALTCGAIAGECERRTLELLALTTISSASIIIGKLLAALCYLGLLILCAAPVFALTVMLGGVSPLEIVVVDLMAADVALLLGALGLLASALVQRTYVATALAYGGMAALALGLLGALASGYMLIGMGGLMLSGMLTGMARWGIPRWRPKWRPQRVHYIMIFGFCLALVAGLVNTPLVETADRLLSTHVQIVDPAQLLASSSGAAAVILGGLSLAGAGAALMATVSLFRALRAPQPDAFETQVRVEREVRGRALRREALS